MSSSTLVFKSDCKHLLRTEYHTICKTCYRPHVVTTEDVTSSGIVYPPSHTPDMDRLKPFTQPCTSEIQQPVTHTQSINH